MVAMILKNPPHKAANYIVIGLSVLFIVYCWTKHWQMKHQTLNPLIPKSLSDIYYKPALLFTGVFSVIVALQLMGLYSKKWQSFSAIFGAMAVVVAWIVYPYVISWFLR